MRVVFQLLWRSSVSVSHLNKCLGVRMYECLCLALKDSWIHLTGERKTFGLTLILTLSVFRQHQSAPFPKDSGIRDVSQLPVFTNWQRKGDCNMFIPLRVDRLRIQNKPCSRFKNPWCFFLCLKGRRFQQMPALNIPK